MLTALLIVARTAHIGATILLAGTFTFKLITLGPAGRAGSDDFHELQRRLLRLARWSLVAALLSGSALVLAGSREHEWIAGHAGLFRHSVADGFV